MTTTLTGKNQITVPAGITRKLGLRTGAQFDWAVSDQPNKIIITIRPTRKQLLERVRAIGRRYNKGGQNPIADLIRERKEDDRMREEALR
jgi:bifunctional DNA-binding transcriptional regulator/antitoxin component of YhaV-PrlF toxin-antitoxin module